MSRDLYDLLPELVKIFYSELRFPLFDVPEDMTENELTFPLFDLPKDMTEDVKKKFRLLELFLSFITASSSEELTPENLFQTLTNEEFQKTYDGVFFDFVCKIHEIFIMYINKEIDIETVCIDHLTSMLIPDEKSNPWVKDYECALICFNLFHECKE